MSFGEKHKGVKAILLFHANKISVHSNSLQSIYEGAIASMEVGFITLLLGSPRQTHKRKLQGEVRKEV